MRPPSARISRGISALTFRQSTRRILPGMDITDIGLFRLADQRLAWTDQRQQLLAQNVANADTPGYRPQDLQPFAKSLAAAGAADAASPVQTNPMHMAGTLPSGVNAVDRMAKPDARAPDGNAVSLQDELAKVAETDQAQEFVLNLYHTYLGMFGTALGKG
jgi:flagellar basal-body rod protein FlgB